MVLSFTNSLLEKTFWTSLGKLLYTFLEGYVKHTNLPMVVLNGVQERTKPARAVNCVPQTMKPQIKAIKQSKKVSNPLDSSCY